MPRHLAKHVRAILATARKDCAAEGATCVLVSGGRHPKLAIERDGRRVMKPICSSPRSEDAAINLARRDVRRILSLLASPCPQRVGRRGLA